MDCQSQLGSGGRKQALRSVGIAWPTIENIEKVLEAGFDVVHFDRDADTVDGLNSQGMVERKT